MRGARWVALLALTCAAAPTWASAQAAMPSDTALRRAQRLVAEGQGAAGRALVDTVLAQAATQPARQAEGLFWRAALAEQASSAERDYQRVTVEHALSPWSGEALLRLGQLAYARGERLAALKSFERIVVEQAETPIAATGHFWKGRVLLEQGDVAPACESLREAARRSAPQAIELRNQVEFYAQRCRETPSAPATAAAPVMAPPASAPVVSANAQTASVPPPVGTAAGASTGMAPFRRIPRQRQRQSELARGVEVTQLVEVGELFGRSRSCRAMSAPRVQRVSISSTMIGPALARRLSTIAPRPPSCSVACAPA